MLIIPKVVKFPKLLEINIVFIALCSLFADLCRRQDGKMVIKWEENRRALGKSGAKWN